MGLAKTEDEWMDRASAFLKAEIQKLGITYEELAKRLKKYGFKETKAGVTNKLARGTFNAAWFLACLAALELEGLRLDEV